MRVLQQTQVNLMNEGGRLQRLSRSLAAEEPGSQASQLVVDERNQGC